MPDLPRVAPLAAANGQLAMQSAAFVQMASMRSGWTPWKRAKIRLQYDGICKVLVASSTLRIDATQARALVWDGLAALAARQTVASVPDIESALLRSPRQVCIWLPAATSSACSGLRIGLPSYEAATVWAGALATAAGLQGVPATAMLPLLLSDIQRASPASSSAAASRGAHKPARQVGSPTRKPLSTPGAVTPLGSDIDGAESVVSQFSAPSVLSAASTDVSGYTRVSSSAKRATAATATAAAVSHSAAMPAMVSLGSQPCTPLQASGVEAVGLLPTSLAEWAVVQDAWGAVLCLPCAWVRPAIRATGVCLARLAYTDARSNQEQLVVLATVHGAELVMPRLQRALRAVPDASRPLGWKWLQHCTSNAARRVNAARYRAALIAACLAKGTRGKLLPHVMQLDTAASAGPAAALRFRYSSSMLMGSAAPLQAPILPGDAVVGIRADGCEYSTAPAIQRVLTHSMPGEAIELHVMRVKAAMQHEAGSAAANGQVMAAMQHRAGPSSNLQRRVVDGGVLLASTQPLGARASPVRARSGKLAHSPTLLLAKWLHDAHHMAGTEAEQLERAMASSQHWVPGPVLEALHARLNACM